MYFLIDDDSGEVLAKPNSSGTIYGCGNLYCFDDIKTGYFFNTAYLYDSTAAPYFECSKSRYCKAMSITKTMCSSSSESTAAKAGELFKTENEVNGVKSEVFNLCLDITENQAKSIILKELYKFGNSYANIDVMVSTNTKNIFGYKSDKFVNVSIFYKNVIFKSKY